MDSCYFAHGGRELVVGGKLTILPGAEVEGLDIQGFKLEGIDESKAATVAALRDDLNALIRALKGGSEEQTSEPEAENTAEEE